MTKTILTCALTGVLTNPEQHRVPVTPEQMAKSAREAFDAGAVVMHCHFRRQEKGFGHLPSWDPEVASAIVDAIRAEVGDVVINMSTGVIGSNLDGPIACLKRCRPEMAALNAGSLNYLRIKENGTWAWPPILFDNPVEKIQKFLGVMADTGTTPECECFDTGILRSVGLFHKAGMLNSPIHVSLVMGVQSGMPAAPDWLPLLVREMVQGTEWQTIAIGREEVWPLHEKTAELGGHLRTGLEDTFYLPDGSKTSSNGRLIEELAKVAIRAGRSVASVSEARKMLALK
ncbi:MAG: 3-keto-5-aminohexanoate cleavage protein [Myxococcales bacterium]|nr:3-keto-5-aminohexanoate cleavage protein [Myxococcales bacterium]